MALKDYLASEIALDHADGLFTRREALRRLGLLGLGAAASSTLLAACGSSGGDGATTSTAAGSASTTSAATASTVAATSSTAAGSTSTAAGAGSSTTAAGATAPGTATATAITFDGPASQLFGSYAAAPSPKGAVLLIHENRGLTQHFKDLPGRFAAAGYSALAVDLLSRQGGTDSFADDGQATAALGTATAADQVADLRAGLDELARRNPGRRLGVVGFCFGGGQVWSLLAAGDTRLAAAVPCYGPGPANPDFSNSPNAAVLGVYAELDSRVNASRDAMEAALAKAGLVHELRTFPGVDHAFFNDTGARYNATQAAAAFQAMTDWFAAHLA